ncbi:MAG: Na+/H+ antiporter NhaA [Nitrospirales bacterium]
MKREILVGGLSEPRQAILPIAAAFGGMVPPQWRISCLIFKPLRAQVGEFPWPRILPLPLACWISWDQRFPFSAKLFLTTLAIVDDLGAVLVITFFYTSDISWISLGTGLGFLVILMSANRLGIRSPFIYGLFGISGLWLAFLFSGLHPTIAGMLAAITIPATSAITKKECAHKFSQEFQRAEVPGVSVLEN